MRLQGTHTDLLSTRTVPTAPACSSDTAGSARPPHPPPSTASPSHTGVASRSPCTRPPLPPSRSGRGPPLATHSPSAPLRSDSRSSAARPRPPHLPSPTDGPEPWNEALGSRARLPRLHV